MAAAIFYFEAAGVNHFPALSRPKESSRARRLRGPVQTPRCGPGVPRSPLRTESTAWLDAPSASAYRSGSAVDRAAAVDRPPGSVAYSSRQWLPE